MGAFRKEFHETKYMYFLIKDEKLLENYNEIWEKVKNSIKKEFDSKHNEKYLKAKIKSYNGKLNTSFYNNEIPRILLIDSVFRTGKKYYPQVFLEE